MRKIYLAALPILMTTFSVMMAIDLYLPAVPDLPAQLGGTAVDAQYTLGAFLASFAIGQLLFGLVADRIGRRWLLTGALVGLVFMLAKGDIERRGRWLIATAFAQVAGLSLVAFAPHVSVAIVITGVLGAIGIVYQNILTTLFLVLPPAGHTPVSSGWVKS